MRQDPLLMMRAVVTKKHELIGADIFIEDEDRIWRYYLKIADLRMAHVDQAIGGTAVLLRRVYRIEIKDWACIRIIRP